MKKDALLDTVVSLCCAQLFFIDLATPLLGAMTKLSIRYKFAGTYSEDSNKSVHLHNLIRVHMKKSCTSFDFPKNFYNKKNIWSPGANEIYYSKFDKGHNFNIMVNSRGKLCL